MRGGQWGGCHVAGVVLAKRPPEVFFNRVTAFACNTTQGHCNCYSQTETCSSREL